MTLFEFMCSGSEFTAAQVSDFVHADRKRVRADTLWEAADKLEEVDPVEWALAGQMAGMDAAVMLRRMAEEEK